MVYQQNPFKPATRAQSKLRLALTGPAGCGKTYTALSLAGAFGRVACIDTERGSAAKYAGLFAFDVLELEQHDPEQYIEAIRAAVDFDYDALVIDSLSHAWNAVLERVDAIAKRTASQNSFAAWRDVTPVQNRLIDAILSAPIHVIATMRAKTEYVMDTVERGGRAISVPRKVGLAPIQRDQVDYEFDVVGMMDLDQNLYITKTRCHPLTGLVIPQPSGDDLGALLKAWLSEGEALMEVSSRWTRIAAASEVSSNGQNAEMPRTFTSEDGWRRFHEGMLRQYPDYAQASFRDVFGVERPSLLTGTLADVEARVKAWAHRHADEEAASGEPKLENDLDRIFGPKPDLEPAADDQYWCDEVQIQKARGADTFSFVLKALDGTTIHVDTGDAFRAAGLDPDAWQRAGHVEHFTPPLHVHATREDGAWSIHAIRVPDGALENGR
jgi:hypothetical protein